jgi:hypothetical protein
MNEYLASFNEELEDDPFVDMQSEDSEDEHEMREAEAVEAQLILETNAAKAAAAKTPPRAEMKMTELWDLSKVALLLETLPLEHRDVPTLRYVLAHADLNGFLKVTYRHGKGVEFGI